MFCSVNSIILYDRLVPTDNSVRQSFYLKGGRIMDSRMNILNAETINLAFVPLNWPLVHPDF